MLKTIHLAHMPPELALHVALYREVKNAPFLKQRLLEGNTEYEYAFIDATTILSTTHVLAATFRAMNDFLHERLKSRNVHSEIVFALSPNNNIGEAFRKFGINETTADLVILRVATSPSITAESVKVHLSDAVQGTSVDFSDDNLRDVSDWAKIRKVYKLPSSQSGDKYSKGLVNGDEEADGNVEELQMAVLGVMALRGAT